MYPKWNKGTTFQSLAQLGDLAAAFPQKKIYVAETSYPADGHIQPEQGYPATPDGQLAYIKAVRAELGRVVPAEQNGGVLWWEASENGWNSLFDARFVARPALLKGFK